MRFSSFEVHFRCFSAFFQGFCGVSQFWGQSKAKPSQFRTGWPSGPVLGPSLSCASLSAGSALAFAVNKAALLKEGSALEGAPKHLQSQRPCTGRDSHDEQFSAKKLNLVNPTVIMAVVRVAEAAEESVVREAEALVEGAGRREALAPERIVRAIVLPCGRQGSFKGEVYQYTTPVPARDGRSKPGFFFWVFRWIVDFLGGSEVANIAGRSREPIGNRTAAVIFDGLSSSDEEVQAMASAADGDEEAVQLPVADDHMTESSMMLKQTAVKKRKAAADDQEDVPEDVEAAEEGPIHRGDFSLSSFACICWLAQLMAKGPRKGAKWNLEAKDVQARAEAILGGMRDTFWKDVRKGGCAVVQGEVSVQSFVKEYGQVAARIFKKQEKVSAVEALRILQGDAARRSLGQDRRRMAEKIFSRFVRSLAEAIDDSVGDPLWTTTRVEALDQLRTWKSG